MSDRLSSAWIHARYRSERSIIVGGGRATILQPFFGDQMLAQVPGRPYGAFHRTVAGAALMSALAAPVWGQVAHPVAVGRAEHTIVYELGWSGGWSRDEGFQPYGGTIAFEVEPVEGWLEVETGVTAIRSGGQTELPVDVLFKKPWQITPQFEFMIGAGPTLTHTFGAERSTFWGIGSVVDLMFWPKRDLGWYLEPGYEVTFRDSGRRNGFGMTVGLLIGR